MNDNAFHEGERAMQAMAGESAIAERNSAMLADTVIGGARPFIANQPMVVTGSVDAQGAVWASLLSGQPGFAHTEDGRAIEIDVPAQDRDWADPLWDNLAVNPELGMLFIDLGTRRRYRVNGTVLRLDGQGFVVAVHEAFPNCPKYIQRRHLRKLDEPRLPGQAMEGTGLHGAAERIVARADTLFVASRHAESGVDASHRGGHRGFVRQVGDTTLRIPDYRGNSMFNTLGNFDVDARAGICIPDFEGGRLLQLTGTARVLWNQDDPHNETGGTGRYWEFNVERWILRDTAQRMEWEYLDASPFNPVAR
jgi:predicted pyridoxine 5'-phosphate oxidase superfamily flavin-nucleotide-binding protein